MMRRSAPVLARPRTQAPLLSAFESDAAFYGNMAASASVALHLPFLPLSPRPFQKIMVSLGLYICYVFSCCRKLNRCIKTSVSRGYSDSQVLVFWSFLKLRSHRKQYCLLWSERPKNRVWLTLKPRETLVLMHRFNFLQREKT